MSVHYHGQGARKSSPNKGPMKATIPITSVFKTSTIKNNNSPISCWKTRISPDHPSGQRSPGSTLYKGKKGASNVSGSVMRRTASLDAIYLKGQWSQDFYMHSSFLQLDKATQTDEAEVSGTDSRKIHSIIEDEKLDKLLIRQRLQRTASKESNGKFIGNLILPSAGSQTSTSYVSSSVKASPISIPVKPLPKPMIRNSVEGLNQEIEKLVLKNFGVSGSNPTGRFDFDKFYQVTPEGHRAPVAELFKSTRSVNTQTPGGADFPSSCPSSGPPSRDSPLTPGHMDSSSEAGGSQNSSPDQESCKLGTSPHINKFLAREPPDGCEKVHLKSLDEQKNLMVDRSPRPCTFQLKPSLGSAFQLLQPLPSNQDIPLVPSQQHLN